MFKTILLIEKESVLKDFFLRVFYVDGYDVIHLNSAAELDMLKEVEINSIDMLLIDECENPKEFMQKFRDLLKNSPKSKVPVLGVLKKGENPEEAHNEFDAVMVKDNFNIQLLCDLVERLTT